jgi:hypothetical protein
VIPTEESRLELGIFGRSGFGFGLGNFCLGFRGLGVRESRCRGEDDHERQRREGGRVSRSEAVCIC